MGIPDFTSLSPRFNARDHCPTVVSVPVTHASSCDPHGAKADPMDTDESQPLPTACGDVDDHVSQSIKSSSHPTKGAQ